MHKDFLSKLNISDKTKKAYEKIFNSEENKEYANIVINDLCSRFYMYHSLSTNDTNAIVKAEGNRQVVLHILGMLSKHKTDYVKEIEQFINREE